MHDAGKMSAPWPEKFSHSIRVTKMPWPFLQSDGSNEQG